MPATTKKDTSPISLSLLHFLPSILLIGMIVVAVLSLGFGEKKTVLGVQTGMPQIRTLTIEDRIKELSGVASKVKSEAITRAQQELTK